MSTLSVTLITYNEELNIRNALESVKWADELIVVDSGSADRTTQIGREYTSKVYTMDWPGFGRQKNRALDLATGDWVLSLDADEVVSPDLQAEIRSALEKAGDCCGFRIPRLSSYCGRFMRHGGWWPDYCLRLFRAGRGASAIGSFMSASR
jgi:glycosyltransferase involved in cell wall biosynthesis